ncbi:peptidoglycan-binding protein [Rhodomicrobium lacus]|uniref:peptidoglycan-binding protein n=1 Tax=Rhodomicrobium lacus TaxID=2498452 RepID=UPI000F8C799E|nr:peptidoglycan-binding protein [Rhodomicrobium lacus]
MAVTLTEPILRALFPRARGDYVQALAQGGRLFEQYGVTTPLRMAHFLAQLAAETGDLEITEESGNFSAARLLEIFPTHFTPAQARAYANKPQQVLSRAYANRLGNRGELSRDGWRYRGRGLIQLTGRENYANRSAIAGVDLVKDPDKAAVASISLKIALQEWIDLGLNDWADRGPTRDAVLACARGINCGSPTSTLSPNGLDARRDAFARIWAVIGDGRPAAVDPAFDGVLEDGERGEAVRRVQRALSDLGYAVGIVDGTFGERTKAAVLVFQQREGLPDTDGRWRVGAYDDVLRRAAPFDRSARAELTADTLKMRGDTQARTLSFGKRAAAWAATLLGGSEALSQADVSSVPHLLGDARGLVEPVADTVRWASQSLWIAGAVGLAALYFVFHRAQQQRLSEVQEGRATP